MLRAARWSLSVWFACSKRTSSLVLHDGVVRSSEATAELASIPLRPRHCHLPQHRRGALQDWCCLAPPQRRTADRPRPPCWQDLRQLNGLCYCYRLLLLLLRCVSHEVLRGGKPDARALVCGPPRTCCSTTDCCSTHCCSTQRCSTEGGGTAVKHVEQAAVP